ncbi:MAG: hypothetical protein IJO06_14125 [Thermoguttaceae bacterium]|nr:hypothetical protein [Thermoguttaceae bacterium]
MTSVPFDASAAPSETPRRPFFFISAGDPSGDAHAARLVEALERRFPNARFVGYAGPKTAATSCDVRVDLTQFAVMWIGRAVANLPNFVRILKNADKIFRDERPDAVILVDFPGFNWKIAKKAKAAGVPVVYFMPPQIWGWGQWRVKKMRRLTDLVLSCFAFEDAWFRENGVRATLVGHPFFESTRNPQLDAAFLADLGSAENGRSTAPSLADFSKTSDINAKVGDETAAATIQQSAVFPALNAVAPPSPASPSQGAQYLTILPGSRNQEVTGNIADLLTTAEKVVAAAPNVRPVVAAFRAEHAEVVRAELERRGLDYPVHVGKTPELMRAATCCLAVSGSVSIELLSLCKPTVILYRIGKPQNFALRFLKRVKYITLTNLLAVSRVPGETPFYPKGEFAKQTEPTARERALMLFPEFISPNDRSDEAAAILADWFLDAASRNRRIAELETLRQATDFVDSPIELAVEKIAEELARRDADSLSL